jgi:hypothetical protein
MNYINVCLRGAAGQTSAAALSSSGLHWSVQSVHMYSISYKPGCCCSHHACYAVLCLQPRLGDDVAAAAFTRSLLMITCHGAVTHEYNSMHALLLLNLGLDVALVLLVLAAHAAGACQPIREGMFGHHHVLQPVPSAHKSV